VGAESTVHTDMHCTSTVSSVGNVSRAKAGGAAVVCSLKLTLSRLHGVPQSFNNSRQLEENHGKLTTQQRRADEEVIALGEHNLCLISGKGSVEKRNQPWFSQLRNPPRAEHFVDLPLVVGGDGAS